ncbi:WXG100 family type VII secretion target [Sanguibacter sp. Z1732]|uniref:WXG100 family type VII secretion target n=1 Tax=Sanguibacter sp. Z1732 TaxID=3435412 RepID=UPI003D9C95AE
MWCTRRRTTSRPPPPRCANSLDGMVAQLRPLETEWTGAAAQAYQGRQREWDIEITEMVDLLGVLAGRVEASAQTYQSTEGDVRSAWA